MTRYAAGRHTDARARVAAALLLFQRGTPFLYYGEELGMRDLPLPRKLIQDPKGKVLWPILEGRDPCRTPMPWTGEPGAGFSPTKAAAPWLPLNPDHTHRNVADQKAEPGSLWRYYQALLALRRAEPALHAGDQSWVRTGDGDVLGFRRTDGGRTFEIWLNFSGSRRRIAPVLGGTVRFATHHQSGIPFAGPATLAPYEVLVIGS